MRDLIFSATLALAYAYSIVDPFSGVLTWSWISFASPHQMVWHDALRNFPWAMVAFFMTILGMIYRKEPKKFFITPIMALISAFVIGITITSFFALAPYDEVYNKYSLIAKSFLFMIITGLLLDKKQRYVALISVMCLSIGYYGVKGGIFAIKNGGQYIVFGPPESMISDNNHLAAAILVSLPLMNFLRLWFTRYWMKLFITIVMMLSILSVLASYSRGALIGLAAMLAVAILRSRKKLLWSMAVVSFSLLAFVSMPERWHARMGTISTYQQDDSAEGRIKIWGASLKIAEARPLVGGGFRAPYIQKIVNRYAPGVTARAVHSIYFEVIGEHGFVVFFLWLLMPIVAILSSMRIIRKTRGHPDLIWASDLAKMSQASIVAYLVAGAFLSLSYWDYVFTIFVMLGSLSYMISYEWLPNKIQLSANGASSASLSRRFISSIRRGGALK